MPEPAGVSIDHIVVEQVRIPCGAQRLVGSLTYPDHGEPTACALLAGPHPFLGGELVNNVVRAVQTVLTGSGAVTLSWNYGGVGGSEGGPADWDSVTAAFWEAGTFEEERGWIDEAPHAQAYLRAQCGAPLILLGYSFGCRVMVHGALLDEAAGIVLLSPNPGAVDFSRLAETSVPLLVVHSTNDFTCSVEALESWYARLREPKTRMLIDAGEHFFRGRENEVAQAVRCFVNGVAERVAVESAAT